MKLKLSELRKLIKQSITEQLQFEGNYSLSLYEIEDFDIDDRYFNITLDFDSEDGIGGITPIKVVETFDPDADDGNGGPPIDIKQQYENNTLPQDWKLVNGLLEHRIPNSEFKQLLISSGLAETLFHKLYEIAKNEAKNGDFE